MDRTEAIFADLAKARAAKRADTSAQKAAGLLDRLFAEQRALITDPSRRKALLCPARAGKSYCFAVYILHTLLTVPRADVLFIAFIRSEAKEILWNLLKSLDEEFQLGLRFSEAELIIATGRGARARLAGCESWGDVDKFRGVPRHLVILDEAATWHAQLLSDLISQVIEPRLGDHKGTLLMGGTPGDVLAGPFYEATGPEATAIEPDEDGVPRAISRPFRLRKEPEWQGVEFKWSLHGWPLEANTSERGRSAYEEALKLKVRNRWSDENPIWVREYLGRWMADDSKLVFRYQAARDDWYPGANGYPRRTPENPFGLPECHAWRFVLSCDMGFHDPFALQVGAYSDTEPNLYQVYEDEGVGLTVSQVAAKLKRVLELADEQDIDVQVADLQGLGGMVVETLAAEHGIFLEKLEQREKRDHIELMNSGLVDKRIKILRGSHLAQEMTYLAWDQTGLKTRANQPNHHCDAFLGVVRHSRHLEAREPEPELTPREAVNARERDQRLSLGRRLERERRDRERDFGV